MLDVVSNQVDVCKHFRIDKHLGSANIDECGMADLLFSIGGGCERRGRVRERRELEQAGRQGGGGGCGWGMRWELSW